MDRAESSKSPADPVDEPGVGNSSLSVAELVAALRREGELLAAALGRAELNAAVPGCPGWTMRDLVRHVGGVHRWATTYVVGCRQSAMAPEEKKALMATWPEDELLVAWFRAGHRSLVQALEHAEPQLSCWTFLPASSPLAFWARRQAHETGIHRADAEAVAGPVSPFPVAVAVDGIEEMLFGFASGKRRLRVDSIRKLRLSPTDSEVEWLVSLGPDGVEATGLPRSDGDCRAAAPASSLFLMLWNRHPPDDVEVSGDPQLIDLWSESMKVRW